MTNFITNGIRVNLNIVLIVIQQNFTSNVSRIVWKSGSAIIQPGTFRSPILAQEYKTKNYSCHANTAMGTGKQFFFCIPLKAYGF